MVGVKFMVDSNKILKNLKQKNVTLVCPISDSKLEENLGIFKVIYPFKQIRVRLDNRRNKSSDEVLRVANKLILNYQLKKIEYFTKNDTNKDNRFNDMFSTMYDEELLYRFLIRLRNYIIYNEMPFSICTVGKGEANIFFIDYCY